MAKPDVVHDPQVLRAIAHPVRNRILGELSAQGSMRAADIARELGIPANQASFHLRSLAKYGLVEEDPGAARDRRDRVWRQVHSGGLEINIEHLEAAPGGPAAASVFRRHAASWGHLVVDAVYDSTSDKGVHKSLTDTSLRLTKAEALQVTAELRAVVDSWAERDLDDDPDRRTYLYYGAVQPYPALPERDDA